MWSKRNAIVRLGNNILSFFQGDISPEVVSQELDNVIQSYDTNDNGYTHDPYERDSKSNGNANTSNEDHYRAKKKRKRVLPDGK